MKKYTEENLQADCFIWLTNNYGLKHHSPRLFMFSVPNELAMTIRGALLQTKLPKSKVDQIISILTQKFKNTGLRSGVSDTVVIMPGKTVYIEFKTEIGVQSDKQKEFQQVVTGNNQSYHLCRSLEQFQSIIQTEIATCSKQTH